MDRKKRTLVIITALLIIFTALMVSGCDILFGGPDPGPGDGDGDSTIPNDTNIFFMETISTVNTPIYIKNAGTNDAIWMDGTSQGFDGSARTPNTYTLDAATELTVTVSWDAVDDIYGGEQVAVFFSPDAGGALNDDPTEATGFLFNLKSEGVYVMETTAAGPNWNTPPLAWDSTGEAGYDGKEITLKISYDGVKWQGHATDGTTTEGFKDFAALTDPTIFANGVYVHVGLDIGMDLTNPLIVKKINGNTLR